MWALRRGQCGRWGGRGWGVGCSGHEWVLVSVSVGARCGEKKARARVASGGHGCLARPDFAGGDAVGANKLTGFSSLSLLSHTLYSAVRTVLCPFDVCVPVKCVCIGIGGWAGEVGLWFCVSFDLCLDSSRQGPTATAANTGNGRPRAFVCVARACM